MNLTPVTAIPANGVTSGALQTTSSVARLYLSNPTSGVTVNAHILRMAENGDWYDSGIKVQVGATGQITKDIPVEDAGEYLHVLLMGVSAVPNGLVAYFKSLTDPTQAQGIAKLSVTLSLATMQAAGAVTSHKFAMGTLPAGARILGCSVGEGMTLLDDGTHATWDAEIGGVGAGDIIGNVNVSAGQSGFPKTGTAGALGYVGAPQGGQAIGITVSSAVNLSTLTAGVLTASVFYTTAAP